MKQTPYTNRLHHLGIAARQCFAAVVFIGVLSAPLSSSASTLRRISLESHESSFRSIVSTRTLHNVVRRRDDSDGIARRQVQGPFPAVPKTVWSKENAPAADTVVVPASQGIVAPLENPDEVKWHLRIGEKPVAPVEPTVGPRLYATPPPAPVIEYAPVPTPAPVAVAVTESPYWRPWETRWDPKPFNMSSPDYIDRPENRKAYRAFAKEHPRHALVPNSIDRDAESTVILVFAFCILGTVIVGVASIEQAQNQKLEALIFLTSLPWLLLALWIGHVVFAFLLNPTRISVATGSHWQCDAMVWYLFFSPLLAALTCVVQVLWVFQANLRTSLAPAPMGRMFDASRQSSYQPSGFVKTLGRIFLPPVVRYGVLAAQFILILFGVTLVFFSGHNRDFCEPEVWWTSALMVTATLVALVLALAATFFCVCLSQFLKLKFVRDLMRSFHDSTVDDSFLENQKGMSEGWSKPASLTMGNPSYVSSGSANMASAAWPAPFTPTPTATSVSSNFEWATVGSPAPPVPSGGGSPSFAAGMQSQGVSMGVSQQRPLSPQERSRGRSPLSEARIARTGSQSSGLAPMFGT